MDLLFQIYGFAFTKKVLYQSAPFGVLGVSASNVCTSVACYYELFFSKVIVLALMMRV